MAIVELQDKARIHALLADDPVATLEALDENAVGMEGLVTVFASDAEPNPINMLAVRWGQKNLGLGSLALLRAGRLTGLEDVVAAFPAERGQFDLLLPFWASGAITSAFNATIAGAEATYAVDRDRLVKSPVARQCTRLVDLEIIKPMFPKLATDVPAYVLALRDQLVSVAAVTHLREDVARIYVYTVEGSRLRGFGRGVMTALAEELIALGITPTLSIDLAFEPAVRMVENAGFYQRATHLKARISGRRDSAGPQMSAPSLVQLGTKRG
jgi:hypothetical protein